MNNYKLHHKRVQDQLEVYLFFRRNALVNQGTFCSINTTWYALSECGVHFHDKPLITTENLNEWVL